MYCRRAGTGSRSPSAPRAIAVVIAVSAFLYAYVATKGSGIVAAGVRKSSQKRRAELEDVIMADLKSGIDGGSSGEGLPFALQRQVVFYRTTFVPGSIVVDRENRFLYLIDGNNSARRYGIGIAQECLKGGSFFRVTNKLEWPDWRPSGLNTKDADALLGAAGRPGSLLGARALLLDKPGLLIHGTIRPRPSAISGCIRLVNDDVEDLYRRVSVETRVIFEASRRIEGLRTDDPRSPRKPWVRGTAASSSGDRSTAACLIHLYGRRYGWRDDVLSGPGPDRFAVVLHNRGRAVHARPPERRQRRQPGFDSGQVLHHREQNRAPRGAGLTGCRASRCRAPGRIRCRAAERRGRCLAAARPSSSAPPTIIQSLQLPRSFFSRCHAARAKLTVSFAISCSSRCSAPRSLASIQRRLNRRA